MNDTWWVTPDQLDKKQIAVLTEPPESDLLILGPPGSGKTNLLLLRSNYVHHIGPRLIFLTFTRTLAEFLKSGPNVGRGDQIKQNDIMTFMKWAQMLIYQHGGTPPSKGSNFEELRENTLSALEQIVEDNRISDLYDFAFIDEVQDFRDRELQVIRRLAGRINWAGDARQRIYSSKEGLSSAGAQASKTVELDKHYRIGEKICQFADRILPPPHGGVSLLEGCNYPEELRASSVMTSQSGDEPGCFADCISRLKEQIRYIVDEPIGVMFTKHSLRDKFWDVLRQDEEISEICQIQRENEYQQFRSNSRIRVMTIHSAKGSEFRAAHILGCENFGNLNRELAFTGVTRAKTEVVLYHVGPLANHMIPPAGELPTNLSKLF